MGVWETGHPDEDRGPRAVGVRETLKNKFAVVQATKRAGETAAESEHAPRRRDYKGKRGRINLRAPQDLLDDLVVLATATGIDKNSFCVEALEKALDQRLHAERSKHGTEAWEVIVRCALGSKAKVDGD